MTRVDRGRHRRTEIDVAEAEHEIAGIKHDASHRRLVIEAVDAPDKLNIRRAPRRVGTDQLLV